jgi:hypothetical protein
VTDNDTRPVRESVSDQCNPTQGGLFYSGAQTQKRSPNCQVGYVTTGEASHEVKRSFQRRRGSSEREDGEEKERARGGETCGGDDPQSGGAC